MVQDYFLIRETISNSCTSITFHYVGQIPPDMQWNNRKKRNDQEYHEKARFFSSNWVWEYCFFCFVFEKISSSLPKFLVMLFVHVGKRLNGRSPMFFKTGVLKNFATFTVKYLCWSPFSIKLEDWRHAFFLKKRLQHKCFSANFAKFLRTAFFKERLFVMLFRSFMWWKILDIWELHFTTVKSGHITERTWG